MNKSEQTKLGIAKARSAGVIWGRGGQIQAARNKEAADEFAAALRDLIFDLMLSPKFRKAYKIAEELERLEIPTMRGGKWHHQTVIRLLNRYGPEFTDELWAARKKRYAE